MRLAAAAARAADDHLLGVIRPLAQLSFAEAERVAKPVVETTSVAPRRSTSARIEADKPRGGAERSTADGGSSGSLSVESAAAADRADRDGPDSARGNRSSITHSQ